MQGCVISEGGRCEGVISEGGRCEGGCVKVMMDIRG